MATLVKEPARIREVHKYYQRPVNEPVPDTRSPVRSNVASTPIAIPDTALTAFLQLITWRLSKQRAIVSLVDKDHQFFIAESTKTGNLVDPSSYEEAGDQQWMGCTGSTTRGEALCVNTIVAEDVPGGYPSFQVTDLPNDPRFADLPYVKGAPYFRFYGGTPLISRAGFRIGSVFVIDDRVQNALTEDELDFLGVMATNVMNLLELQAESLEQRRHMTMSRGLAALVEGRARIPSDWDHGDAQHTGTTEGHSKVIDSVLPENARKIAVPEAQLDARTGGLEDDSTLYQSVFARAANLLRESLDVDYTLFLDTSSNHGVKIESRKPETNVVGYSKTDQSSIGGSDTAFTCRMDQDFLSKLCQQYHDGKIWSYLEDGTLEYDDETPMSLSSDDDGSSSGDNKRMRRSQEESGVLQHCFPNARQILFAPLWDSATGLSNPECFSGCFAISYREVPVFTTKIEVAFVRAFVNSVGVILGHLAASLGEKQKSQFISSMSHELRSPLHGILASTELLYGTSLSVIQTDLCDTVDVCGQTLLDTLSQILDYSKVNNFLRDTHNANELDSGLSQSNASVTNASTNGVHAGSSLHVYSECDVCWLCEEALDVVSMSFRQTLAIGSPIVTPLTELGSLSTSQRSADETVVVDFAAPNEDWRFLCSPGAIRRIVMNLVGNSFKYTETGSISVELSLQDNDESAHDARMIVISVTDTGKGMSEDFMRKRLFVPFSQENSVAPGSGLGLSLVQGIVKSLGGKIEVWSKAGRGTKMEVSVPLKRASKHSLQLHRQPEQTSTSRIHGKTYKFFGLQTAMHQLLQDSIRLYMRTWWNMVEVTTSEAADFFFIDAHDLTSLSKTKQVRKLSCHTIVLSPIASLPDVRSIDRPALGPLEPLRVPFGPKKLEKALQSCVKRTLELHVPFTGIENEHDQPNSTEIEIAKMPPPKTPLVVRPRLDPENRRKTVALSTVTLSTGEYVLPRQTSQPIPQLKDGPAVLCVDDNAINLKLLNTFAKKLGFDNVVSAEDGLQAFQATENCARGFDVIFMDLTMPVMDGFESTRRIRKLEGARKGDGGHGRPSIIVALTGLASDEDQKRAFSAGVSYFVTKPLRFKDLKQMLSDWNLDAVGHTHCGDGVISIHGVRMSLGSGQCAYANHIVRRSIAAGDAAYVASFLFEKMRLWTQLVIKLKPVTGAVNVIFTGEAIAKFMCSCLDDRKITGSLFGATNLMISTDEMLTTKGELKTYTKTVESGNEMTSHFCAGCGSTLYRVSSGYSGVVMMKAGCIDDFKPAEGKPQLEMFSRDHVHWVPQVEDIDHKRAGLDSDSLT